MFVPIPNYNFQLLLIPLVNSESTNAALRGRPYMMSSRYYWGGGQVFCDDSTTALILKRVTVGEGGPKLSNIV